MESSGLVFPSQSSPYIPNDLHPTLFWLTICGPRMTKKQIKLLEKLKDLFVMPTVRTGGGRAYTLGSQLLSCCFKAGKQN